MRYANDPEIEEQIAQFGRNMRVARRRTGMTQTELASVDGLDRAAISLTEKGKRSPDMRTLLRIAEGLEVTAAELVHGIGPSQGGRQSGARGRRRAAAATPGDSIESASSAGSTQPDRSRAAATATAEGFPFSENLYSARRRAGLSQQTLGARADVDAAAISLYERGQRQPNLRTVLKLARTLEIAAAELLRDVR